MNFLSRLFPSALLVLALAAGACPAAHATAGSSPDAHTGVDVYGEPAVRAFAQKLNTVLDDRKANVAILARSGRPRRELPSGLSYTHVAIAIYEPVKDAQGAVGYTYCIYNLYQGADGHDDRSYLAQDFTYDFVAGSRERDIAVIIPSDELQRRIAAVVHSPAYRSLQNTHYNVVANPWKHETDNCVTHTLRIVVAAIYQTSDDRRIEDDIRAYFQPTPIHIAPWTEFGAHFARGVSFADEDPNGLQTASYESLKQFLVANGLIKENFLVNMP